MLNKKIAWIEDDIDVIDPVVKPLRLAGFEILEFGTFYLAYEEMETLKSCDLILLDLILPAGKSGKTGDLLGLELLEEFQKRGFQMPIIVLSVLASIPDWHSPEFHQLKISPLPKPVRPSALKAEVYRCLELQNQEPLPE